MKRIQKHLFLLVLTLLVLFVSPFTLSGPADAAAAEPVPGTQTGWVKSGTKIYYYNAYGKKLTGKKKINGKVYYFSKKRADRGALQTGLVRIGSKEFFFKKTGSLGVIGSGANGWVNIKGRGICYCKNGRIQKKNCIDDYYLKSNGAMTSASKKMYKLVKKTVKKLVYNGMTKEQKLLACYKYLCSSTFRYVTKRPFSYAQSWRLTYGYEMLTTYSGVCYNFSAALAYMARYIGYTKVKAIAGELLYLDGHWDLHSWTKIMIDGVWYVFDASMQHGGMGDFWKKTYAGTGRKYREWTTL